MRIKVFTLTITQTLVSRYFWIWPNNKEKLGGVVVKKQNNIAERG